MFFDFGFILFVFFLCMLFYGVGGGGGFGVFEDELFLLEGWFCFFDGMYFILNYLFFVVFSVIGESLKFCGDLVDGENDLYDMVCGYLYGIVWMIISVMFMMK